MFNAWVASMSDALPEKFNLVFRGQLAKGVDSGVAKKNIAQLFKISDAKVEAMFSGKAIVLKRGLTADAANKYRVAIKKAGALVEVEQERPPETRGRAVFVASTENGSSVISGMGAIPGTETNVEKQKEESDGETGLSLAPIGTEVLTAKERPVQPVAKIDTSNLSLRPPGESLLDASEYKVAEPAHQISSSLELAPSGTDVLKPQERRPEVVVDVDISGLKIDESGAKLSPQPKTPPPPPDISGIALVKN